MITIALFLKSQFCILRNQLTRQVQSSIIEQLISLLIVILCLSLAFQAVSKAIISNNHEVYQQAVIITDSLMVAAVAQNQIRAQELQFQFGKIVQKVSTSPTYPQLKSFTIDCFDHHDRLLLSRELLLRPYYAK